MFHNPAYKGVYRYGSEENTGVVPALVEPELWDAVQRPLQIHPRTAAGAYLLSGMLRCGHCGAAMSGFVSSRTLKSGRTWRKRYYICGERNTTIDGCRALLAPADDLEAAVLQLVFAGFLDPQPFAALLAAVRAESAAGDVSAQRWVLHQVIASLSYGPQLHIAFKLPTA